MTMVTIPVSAERDYDVVIGRGLMERIGPAVTGATRVAVLHPQVMQDRARELADVLRGQGISPLTIELPDGEDAKTAATTQRCWDALGAAGFTRNDAVVGLGGGSTTDLAGFVAATWLRGVRVIQVPTTLLGMVDAAVGGKTGINTAAGKNLVGCFWSPSLVIIDLDLLTTLPKSDLVAGMAEVIKVGLTSDPSILDDIEADPQAALDPSGAMLASLVARAVRVKAQVVSQDFREAGVGGLGREVLNYGHTFGHAVEREEHYRWRHGDAIAVGLVYVAELAHRAGLLSSGDVERHHRILEAVGLPTSYRGASWPDLRAAMAIDKKARGATLRFVALRGIGDPVPLDGPDEAQLEAAYLAVSGAGPARA
mgnify:FL=1